MGAHGPKRGAASGGRACGGCGSALAWDNTGHLCSGCVSEQRDHLRTPPAHLPDDFWETDEFKAAFKAQHIGKVLKAYRNHPRHRQIYGRALSQSTLGRWLNLEQPKISRMESGGPEPNADIVREYAKKLHIPARLLWLLPEGESFFTIQNRIRAVLIEEPNRDGRAVEPQAEQLLSISPEPALDRREFMLVASGTVLSMTESLHRGLSSRAGKSDLEYLLNRTARLRRLDNYLGGRDTYNLYVSELVSTVGYVRNVNCGPNIHKALIKVIAEQAQLAGWAAFDAGMHVEAKKHYKDSLDAAREANDAALMGNALAFLAYQEVSTIGPNVGLAEASFVAAEKEATPRVRALLLERKAWTYAVAGDYQATNKALADAKAALRIKNDQPEPDWVFWVDENEIDIMTGRCLTELRRPSEAVSALDAALLRFDDTYARDKALYMTFLANALIDSEEIERAATVTAKSIELAQGVGSVRPSARITGVMHKLRKFKDLESVSQLFEQVRD